MEAAAQDNIYPKIFLNNLKTLKSNLFLCDTTITNGLIRISAHKAVLAASSPYFQCLYCGSIEFSDEDTVINDLDSDSLTVVIEYIYSGKVELSMDNIFSILFAADFLQLSSLRSFCEGFLCSNIVLDNCISIYLWAERMNLYDLTQKALHYMLDNFDLVVMESEFLDLSHSKLLKILESPWQHISDQSLFEAILRWINHKPEDRKMSGSQCLKFIDLINISSEVLLKYMEDGSGLDTATILLLKDAVGLKNAISYDGKEVSDRVERFNRMEEALLCIGGESDGDILCSVECLAFRYDGWKYHIPCLIESDVNTRMKVLPPMHTRRSQFAVTGNGFKVFVIGGCNAIEDLRHGECYDVVNNEWYQIASMPEALVGAAATLLNGMLYVTGGRNGSRPTNKLYVYDPKSNSWSQRQSMIYHRAHHGLVSLNGMIYAIGGVGGSEEGEQEIMNSMERYDFMSNSWLGLPNMQKHRSHAGFVACDNKIYALAGLSSSQLLNCVEIYDPAQNLWSNAGGIGDYRSNFGFTISNGRIYCVGGMNDNVVLNSVQKYNTVTHRWHAVYGMLTKRCGAGAATVLIPVKNEL